MADDNLQKLEARIQQLEKMLTSMHAHSKATDLSADDINAYIKVRDVVAPDWGDFCGINDCFRCVIYRCHSPLCIVRCIVRCINECVCGPCLQGGGYNPRDMGLSRFGNFAE